MTQKSAKEKGHCQQLKTYNKLGVSRKISPWLFLKESFTKKISFLFFKKHF